MISLVHDKTIRVKVFVKMFQFNGDTVSLANSSLEPFYAAIVNSAIQKCLTGFIDL